MALPLLRVQAALTDHHSPWCSFQKTVQRGNREWSAGGRATTVTSAPICMQLTFMENWTGCHQIFSTLAVFDWSARLITFGKIRIIYYLVIAIEILILWTHTLIMAWLINFSFHTFVFSAIAEIFYNVSLASLWFWHLNLEARRCYVIFSLSGKYAWCLLNWYYNWQSDTQGTTSRKLSWSAFYHDRGWNRRLLQILLECCLFIFSFTFFKITDECTLDLVEKTFCSIVCK